MIKVFRFIKSEAVLTVSFILAVISAFFIVPSYSYIDYIDFRTLSLLFCLMAIMAGLKKAGVFSAVSSKLLNRVSNSRALTLSLSLMCFFFSMLITNDVALITFVPFTVITFKLSNLQSKLIYTVTLETVAANLGSMLTPIGNPQNLYLFSTYNMDIKSFFLTLLPYGALSLVLIIIFSFFTKSEKVSSTKSSDKNNGVDLKSTIIYSCLFLLALLTVLRIIPYYITLALSVAVIFIADKSIFKHIDYSLLFTFVFLFIFIGNLGKIAPISDFLVKNVTGRETEIGILSSQIFSNVPAAILLSGFTDNAKALLIGVNLGGLGTLIASMASLISFKLIAKENVKTGRYLLIFTLINIIFLALNYLLFLIIG